MAKYDAIVVGGGAAGFSAGALLAKVGKKVLVVDENQYPGGRCMTIPYEGYRLNLGGHLLEDGGSGLTKIMEFVGKKLEHGPINNNLSVYQHGKWMKVQDLYQADRADLKKVIKAIVESDWEDFDKLDNMTLRGWLSQYTSSEGIFALYEFLSAAECMTDNWWDHSASVNLYARKMHYMERNMAAYSCWPVGGFDKIFNDLIDAIKENGGDVMTHTKVNEVCIEDGMVKGVFIEKGPKATPNEWADVEFVEAPIAIVTVPVWNLLKVVPARTLPDWITAKVELLARDEFKTCWLGYYAATKEPICVNTPEELASWSHAPYSKLPGFSYLMTALDPTTAPPGVHLFTCGFTFQGGKSKEWIDNMYKQTDKDLAAMFPGWNSDNLIWVKKHLVYDPPFGVINKPGLVGNNRPDNEVPNVQGLYLAGETYRSRGVGIDAAARSALTVVERIMGNRISFFNGTWRY